MKIGVLALQGAFQEHQNMLESLGAETFQIRQYKDLNTEFDALILPGGESTTICKLLSELNMLDDLRNKIQNGLPVFGTCAGLILLSKKIKNQSTTALSTMDIECSRNAYGRQLGSFSVNSNFADIGEIPMVFIRAPYITQVSASDVKILAEIDGKIVAAKQKNQLVTAFHPELTNNIKVHSYFLNNIVKMSK